MTGILNYGLGNVGSITNILKKIGVDSILVNNQQDFKIIDSLIIPGVGSFDYGMKLINNLNLIDALNKHAIIEKKLTIGICLGMQLMFKSSEEGQLPGLGWIDENVCKFNFKNKKHKIPHMGWNYTSSIDQIFKNTMNENRYYFVHSFFAPVNSKYTLSTSSYAGKEFSSSIRHNNIFGFQFHPEKSHNYGLSLLTNLFKLYARI
jgi:glutamine amidotransferase